MSQIPDSSPDAAGYIVEQILITLDRLRDAWGWLGALVEPGRTASAPTPAMSDARAERLEATGHSDRAYRSYNLSHGMSALPPSPAAARIGIIDAQALVASLVVEAAQLVAAAAQSVYIGGRERQDDTVRCALDWLDGPALLELRDESIAARVDRLLQRADRTARQAAQCDEDPPQPLVDPHTGRPPQCPVCGRRSLQRERSAGRTVVRCISQQCRCAGDAAPGVPGCRCGVEDKLAGAGHVWSLADEPRLWEAIEATPARVRRGVGRSARGHGGWQSRNMGGAQ